ncbi:alpha/beta fold hydrolase [Streptomyces sp. NBC_01477]|uniref:alpha/beta fold hydrolase n=1 Tax=Streptomyces sp. NBC_01477 TaxID=2976015 RepID=UPI002E3302FD|nr:alpha/beta fold hydrolase [Streptomyces sp. NBC_01477]
MGRDERTAAVAYRAMVMGPAPAAPEWAVLVLHGGTAHGMRRPSWLNLPARRMGPFIRAMRDPRIAFAEARYRHRGWNGERADTAKDAAEALAALRERTGGVPTVLVGHSLGARAALRIAAEPGVVGVVALAAWCPPEDPVAQLAGSRLVFAHATADRITSPRDSLLTAARAREAGARVCRYEVPGGDHAMLRHAGLWHTLATAAVHGLLGLRPLPPEAASAFALPARSTDGLALKAVPRAAR